jgi:putative oxidoreductase
MTILKTTGVWALTILLTLFFLFAGYKKLTASAVTAGHFREWGYAHWLLTFVGCLELTGAILLIFPATATSGALLLSLIMVGASYTLLSHEVWQTLTVTTTCLVLLILLGYIRWNQSWVLSVFKMNG